MKKILVILGLILAPGLALASFDKDFGYGAVGQNVKELQDLLTDQGLYTGPLSGNFFNMTKTAVKAFQTREGIRSTGYVGPLTRARLNALLETTDEEGAPITPVVQIPATTNDVVSTLNAQLLLLTQQVQALQTQQNTLVQIQTQQQTQNTILGQIQTNTTPAPQPAPAPVVDKSEIKASYNGPVGVIPVEQPYGVYYFKVSLLDSTGKYTRNPITVTLPTDNGDASRRGITIVTPNAQTGVDTNDWYGDTTYIPTTSGEKTFTFTAGVLSKTITFTVTQ